MIKLFLVVNFALIFVNLTTSVILIRLGRRLRAASRELHAQSTNLDSWTRLDRIARDRYEEGVQAVINGAIRGASGVRSDLTPDLSSKNSWGQVRPDPKPSGEATPDA